MAGLDPATQSPRVRAAQNHWTNAYGKISPNKLKEKLKCLIPQPLAKALPPQASGAQLQTTRPRKISPNELLAALENRARSTTCRATRPLPARHSRDLLVGHRRLPRERRHEDGGLFQLVLAHALRIIRARVARTLVIAVEVLDHVEAGQPGRIERDVIG